MADRGRARRSGAPSVNPRPLRRRHSPPTAAERWPVSGPAFLARWLTTLHTNGQLTAEDPDATALVMHDALTAYWRQHQTHGDAPYVIEPDRYIEAWTNLILALV